MTVAEPAGEFEGVVDTDEQTEVAGDAVAPIDPEGLLLDVTVVV